MKRTVSAVLLSRDRLQFTQRALSALASTSGISDIIVVDNGSSDGSVEWLRAWCADDPSGRVVIENSQDAGGSTTRNQGAALAASDFLLFVDNDVDLVDPSWLEILVGELLHTGEAAAAPLLVFPGGTYIQSAGGGWTRAGHFGLLKRGLAIDEDALGVTHVVAWAPTAALLVRRNAFEVVGGFDEAFDPVSVCEDIDLCARISAESGSVLHVPKSRLIHYEGTTFNSAGHDKLLHWRKNGRVIRNRWARVLENGPLSSEDDICWRPVLKHYDDPPHPWVEPVEDGHSFFDVEGSISRSPTVQLSRVGVVGVGQVFEMGLLPGFSSPASDVTKAAAPFLNFGGSDGVRIVSLCDTDVAHLERVADSCGIRHRFTDWRELMNRVPLEAVAVCSPPATHVDIAEGALDRGLAVFLEKPGATSLEDLKRLDAACERAAEYRLMVNFSWLYHPAVETLRRFIRESSGDVRLSMTFGHAGPQAWSSRATWSRGGGLSSMVLDLGSHLLAVAHHLTGQRLSLVSAESSDPAKASGEFAGSKCSTYLNVSWNEERPRFDIRLEQGSEELDVHLVPWSSTIGRGIVARNGRTSRVLEVAPDALGGGPYRSFIRQINENIPAASEFSRVRAAMETTVRWSSSYQ